jgi:hypothetical protein
MLDSVTNSDVQAHWAISKHCHIHQYSTVTKRIFVSDRHATILQLVCLARDLATLPAPILNRANRSCGRFVVYILGHG